MTQQSAFFTKLPLEIRLRIYSHALMQAEPISLLDLLIDNYYNVEFRRTAGGVLLACAQSNHEVRSLLWEVNTVRFTLAGVYIPAGQRALLSSISGSLRSLVLLVLPTMYHDHLFLLRSQLERVQGLLDAAHRLAELKIVVVESSGRESAAYDELLRCFARLRFEGQVTIESAWQLPIENRPLFGPSAECIEEVKAAINRNSVG